MAKTRWKSLAAFVIVVVLVLSILSMEWELPSRPMPVPVGTQLPRLAVAGWVNVEQDDPLPADHGLVVVDCWATWCPPCRAEMPRLAKMHQQYAPLGVTFLGLTSESERDLPKIEGFIETVPGFTWPVAYGAGLVMDDLNIQALPTLIVFDAQGQAIWSANGSHGLPEVLDAALAR